ncbi:type II toxin-antitoxin system PemK/MazF family toxin [uncultured Amphritea sp.]|mgnify:CR=1 FL=1|uniref:type II toxin-antitoxin system PemK/MazF family toxin n=1 Tax=uncultured Amphritea sp. TaxID=981605 RepID=UPI00261E2C57|nr:type II toxin-antitoxin system PemK/MazF family toxin [uncultured Amphritea sp.]
MTTIKVTFLKAEEPAVVLGEEVSSDIAVRELPHDPVDQNIFIRKEFTSSEIKFWKVEKIDTVHDTENKIIACEITISPLQYLPKSISEKHSSNGSKLVRGRLLECDFGYFSQDISLGDQPSTTISNFNGKLPYEMVKRRLVVVLSNKEDPALVVPISKGNKAKDHRTVVGITSLPPDLVTFNNPTCFAKTAAISYVSGHRLFPVRFNTDEGKRLYDYRVEKKLSNDDVVNIKKAVFTAVGGDNILRSIESKDEQIDSLNGEIASKNNKIEGLETRNAELWSMLEEYTK